MNRILSITVAISIGLVVTSVSNAQDPDVIPKKALKELDFMAGKWQTDVYEDDKKVGSSVGERKWAPGKYCLQFSTSLEINGEKFEGTGISGWTRKGKGYCGALVCFERSKPYRSLPAQQDERQCLGRNTPSDLC
jgi:hypothetical protein